MKTRDIYTLTGALFVFFRAAAAACASRAAGAAAADRVCPAAGAVSAAVFKRGPHGEIQRRQDKDGRRDSCRVHTITPIALIISETIHAAAHWKSTINSAHLPPSSRLTAATGFPAISRA